jgi:hypothetical protein
MPDCREPWRPQVLRRLASAAITVSSFPEVSDGVALFHTRCMRLGGACPVLSYAKCFARTGAREGSARWLAKRQMSA